jgi:transcriptional regulator with XRE-family HTH domain
MYLIQPPKLISTRQLKAARALAGLTQRDLGQLLGVDERQIRFWEKRIPTQSRKRRLLEQALEKAGIECYATPAIGVRCLWRATDKIMLNIDIWCADVNPLLAFFCALSRARDRYQENLQNSPMNATDCTYATSGFIAYNLATKLLLNPEKFMMDICNCDAQPQQFWTQAYSRNPLWYRPTNLSLN